MEENNDYPKLPDFTKTPTNEEIKETVDAVVDKVNKYADKVGNVADKVSDKVGDVAGAIVDKIEEHANVIEFITPQIPVFVSNIIFKVLIFTFLILGISFSWGIGGWFLFMTLTILDVCYTKKIAARKLVGINYSCRIEPNGDNTWKFEKLVDQMPTTTQRICFWSLELAVGVLECIMLIIYLFKFNIGWMFVLTVTATINLVNLYLMNKCSNELEVLLKRKVANVLQNPVFQMTTTENEQKETDEQEPATA